MDKWEEKEIGDCIVEIQTGKTPPKSNKAYYENSSVDWFSPSDFDDDIKELSNSKNKISELAVAENKAKIYPLNSLLLVGIGATIGKVGLLKYTASSNQQITALTFQENINADFAYYWFRNLKGHIVNMSSSATMPIINQKEIKKLPFRYPKSLPEQQRIVTKLDGLFAKIDQAMGLLEENILHTQALMGSLLDAEFSKLLDKYGKVELISLCDKITDGSHHSPKAIENGTIPYVTVRDVSWEGKIDTVHCKKISKLDFIELERNGCKPLVGDVLLSKDGTVGKVAIVDFDMDWVVLSSLAIIRPNIKKIDSIYLSWMLKIPRIQKIAIGLKTGAAIKRIVLRTIKTIEIPASKNMKDQEEISQYFDDLNKPYQKLIETQTDKLKNLKALKSSLLDQAFKGEL